MWFRFGDSDTRYRGFTLLSTRKYETTVHVCYLNTGMERQLPVAGPGEAIIRGIKIGTFCNSCGNDHIETTVLMCL